MELLQKIQALRINYENQIRKMCGAIVSQVFFYMPIASSYFHSSKCGSNLRLSLRPLTSCICSFLSWLCTSIAFPYTEKVQAIHTLHSLNLLLPFLQASIIHLSLLTWKNKCLLYVQSHSSACFMHLLIFSGTLFYQLPPLSRPQSFSV